MVHGTPEFNRRGRLMRRTILDNSTNSLVLIASYVDSYVESNVSIILILYNFTYEIRTVKFNGCF